MFAGEARCERVEPFPSRGDVNNGGEHRRIVVEKELYPVSAAGTAYCTSLVMSVRSGCVTRGMRAATVTVCATAEWDEAAMRQRVQVAV